MFVFFSSGCVLRRRLSIYPCTMTKVIMRMVFLIQASYVLNAEPFPNLTMNALTARFACLVLIVTVAQLASNVLQVTVRFMSKSGATKTCTRTALTIVESD